MSRIEYRVESDQHPAVYCPAPDSARLDSMLFLLEAAELYKLRIGEAAIAAGKLFLGQPYTEKTLEVNEREKLVINLHGVDCTTFLETAITFGRLGKLEHFSQEAYWRELAAFRYIKNWPDGYASRLHYFSDWIATNSEKQRVCDITAMLGGIPYPNSINFMSTHPQAYPALKDNPDLIPFISQREEETNRKRFFFIPKANIASAEKHMLDGDIIAITTGIDGLDIIHTGLAFWQNGRIHMLHASSNSMKVEITEKPLSDYMKDKKSQTGIMVARLVEP
ncbi:MAG: DUF1460 domain-containing protein [Bacteroidia bacterium]